MLIFLYGWGEGVQGGDGFSLTDEKRQPYGRLYLCEGMAYVETLHGGKCNVWNNGRKAQRTKLCKKVDSSMK